MKTMMLAVQKYIKRTLCNLTGNSWTLLTWSEHTTQVLKNVLNCLTLQPFRI